MRKYQRRAHCGRKIKHNTVEDAEAHIRELAQIDQDSMVIYICDVCGKYHVGHERIRKAKQRERNHPSRNSNSRKARHLRGDA